MQSTYHDLYLKMKMFEDLLSMVEARPVIKRIV